MSMYLKPSWTVKIQAFLLNFRHTYRIITYRWESLYTFLTKVNFKFILVLNVILFQGGINV